MENEESAGQKELSQLPQKRQGHAGRLTWVPPCGEGDEEGEQVRLSTIAT